jgi:hypothetical protein
MNIVQWRSGHDLPQHQVLFAELTLFASYEGSGNFTWIQVHLQYTCSIDKYTIGDNGVRLGGAGWCRASLNLLARSGSIPASRPCLATFLLLLHCFPWSPPMRIKQGWRPAPWLATQLLLAFTYSADYRVHLHPT